MTAAERWRRMDALFAEALERPPEERGAFLDTACAGDAGLRREVEGLLEADERSATFLEHPAGELLGLLPDGEEGGRLGPYRLLRRLGSGGMGTVYLARREDEHYRQEVAIKVLRSGLQSTEALHRFLAERQILARLEHPNIARLYDGGNTEDGRRPYLVMELVEGLPVDEYCDRRQLTVDQRLDLFRRICSAVQYAHQNLLVHRDLKPANILVTAAGEPKLLDFGIAKRLEPEAADASLTRTGLRVLTPSYASPEQVKGEPITTASDVYSLGVLLYGLLAGRGPYRAGSGLPHEIERAICEQEPERPSLALVRAAADGSGPATPEEIARARGTRPPALRRRLRGDLDNIALMALRKEPGRRYGSAAQLSGEIDNHLQNLPVAARPDTLLYRGRKFLRRHRAAAVAAALMVLVVLGFVASLLVQRRQVVQERDRARYALSFLVDTFKGADPYHTRGEHLTAGEILDQGARRVSRDLARQPDVQATLMDAIGQVELVLGRIREAAPLLEGALARRRRLAPGSPETVQSLEHLAELRMKQSDFAGAEALLREALATERRLPRRDDLETARVLNLLGEALAWKGSVREAEALHREALSLGRRAESPQGIVVAESLLGLARRAQERGDYPRAERFHREGFSTLSRAFGEGDPRLVNEQKSLGAVLIDEGKMKEAEALFRAALAAQRKVLGDDHPEVLELLSGLAIARQSQGDSPAAEALDREIVRGCLQRYGEWNRQTAEAISNLGTVLESQGRNREAIVEQERALAIRRRIYGERHSEVAHSLLHLSKERRELGQTGAALALGRQSLEIEQATLGPEHPYGAYPEEAVGMALRDQHRAGEAEPHLRHAVELLRKAVPENHPQLAKARMELAKCLADLGRLDEAGSLLRQAERGGSPR